MHVNIILFMCRKIAYKQNYMCETIRPARVLKAVEYLVTTDLFKRNAAVVSSDWLENFEGIIDDNTEAPFVVAPEDVGFILSKVVDEKEISLEEAKNLQFKEKARLIRTDPVTCARYFDHRFQTLLKLFRSEDGIFGKHKVIYHYYRIEFQHRGSPHVHGLFWLRDVPSI